MFVILQECTKLPTLPLGLGSSITSFLAMTKSLFLFEQSLALCGPSHKKHANSSLLFSPSLVDFPLAGGFPLPLFFYPSLSPPLLPLIFVEFDFLNSINDSATVIALVRSWTPLIYNSCLVQGLRPSIKEKRASFSPRSKIWSMSSENSRTYSRTFPCWASLLNFARDSFFSYSG